MGDYLPIELIHATGCASGHILLEQSSQIVGGNTVGAAGETSAVRVVGVGVGGATRCYLRGHIVGVPNNPAIVVYGLYVDRLPILGPLTTKLLS